MRNLTKFQIYGLNQEKILVEISKSVNLFDINRKSKNETEFKCSYFDHKKVSKILKGTQLKVVSVTHEGIAPKISKCLTSWGAICAVVLCFVFYGISSQFVLQYDVLGVDKLDRDAIVSVVKQNFSNKISQIDTDDVENKLIDSFTEISFASCMIRGQTLVINIKEKLLPNEMYGDFQPIYAQKDGKITEIDLVSGTLKVKVGDYVKKGDVLVEPFTLDTSGNLKKVEAKANITGEVYHEGTAEHCETYVEVKRTGRVAVRNDVMLFGLKIYHFEEKHDFEMFETEEEEYSLIKNLVLPFKVKKTLIYELEKNEIISKFEDVEQEFVAKAKAKALEKVGNCDKIKEEFYSVRHISSVSVVKYEIVTEEEIGGTYDD